MGERRVGPYRLVERLGRGGMGEVWLAEDPTGAAGGAPRRVALKLLDPGLLDDPAARARFAREVAAARRVRGACVAALLDADVAAEQPWLASAYVAGPTLAEHVDRHGVLADAPLRALGEALADALVAMHRAGVVHRDLTPRNVVLGPDGPRVVDFGIAAIEGAPPITQAGSWVGTPAWMAPERAAAAPDTPASDVWSWGAVMAYAARGRPALAGHAAEAAARAARGELDLEGVPAWLQPTVRAAMAPDPRGRPSAAALLDAMAHVAAAGAPPGGVPDTVADDPTTLPGGPGGDTRRETAGGETGDRERGPAGTGRSAAGPTGPEGSAAGPAGTGRSAAGPAGTGGSARGPAGTGRSAAGPAGTEPGPPGPGTAGPAPTRRVARWASAAALVGAAAILGLVADLLVTLIATAVLVMAAVGLAIAREGSPEGARPVPPTWAVGLAGPVALGAGLTGVFGPVGGLAAIVVLVMVFVVLGGDIA
ncbi:MAG TPA: serine/threonine-protein kinase [Acidimicrobiales bacterium]